MMVDGVDNEIKSSALELIGNTPLVALDRLHPGPGRLLAKCEFMNPCGSVKSRSALHMIQIAIKEGLIQPDQSILEVTSGNQGCGLGVVCAVLGYPLTILMSHGNSVQRAIHMKALGAECIRVPQVEGKYGSVTASDVDKCKEEAAKIVEKTGAYYVSQFNNENNVEAHYITTGPEIWRQTGGHVDAFVTTVGTAGTFVGTSKYLKEKNPNVRCVVVEPVGNEPIKGEPITKIHHLLQGSSYGRIPVLFEFEFCDETISVSDEEAVEYMQRLGQQEGLYVGYTSGANVAAAVKLLASGRLPPHAWVVTMLCDTGLKYINMEDIVTS